MKRLAAWLAFAGIGLGLAAALAAAVSGGAALTGSDGAAAARTVKAPAPSADGGKTKEGARPSAGPDETALLHRLEPRAPLSGLAAPAPPPPPPDPDSLPKRWRLVHRPVAAAAGILQAGGMTIALPGIDSVTVNETCAAPSGASWPCGMAARTAFRAYLRSRALNCRLPDAPIETAISAECLLQGEDPARWLVSQGWARAKPDGPFSAEGAEARAARRGIFGGPPR